MTDTYTGDYFHKHGTEKLPPGKFSYRYDPVKPPSLLKQFLGIFGGILLWASALFLYMVVATMVVMALFKAITP